MDKKKAKQDISVLQEAGQSKVDKKTILLSLPIKTAH
jgi:hypothetical protein